MEASAVPGRVRVRRPRLVGSVRWLRLRSDEQLVALVRAGNEDAFAVIHDRYRPRLLAFTRQMLAGSRQDAEDALQDVFVRAHGALLGSDAPMSLRAWLYRLAHNRCIDELRRPALPPTADGLELLAARGSDPVVVAERREDLLRLVADIRRLPDAQRSALLMRELDGLSYPEIAAALDVTIPAVKSLLVRARIGLAAACEAREAPCRLVRIDLAAARDRGARPGATVRRHLRDCPACHAYRQQLNGTSRSLAALGLTVGPASLVAKLLGFGTGGASTGGAATGGAALTGGSTVAGGGTVVSGSVAAAAATKAAAVAAVAVAAATGVHAATQHHQHQPVASVPASLTTATTSAEANAPPSNPTAESAATSSIGHRTAILRRHDPRTAAGSAQPDRATSTGGASAPTTPPDTSSPYSATGSSDTSTGAGGSATTTSGVPPTTAPAATTTTPPSGADSTPATSSASTLAPGAADQSGGASPPTDNPG